VVGVPADGESDKQEVDFTFLTGFLLEMTAEVEERLNHTVECHCPQTELSNHLLDSYLI